MECPVCEVDMLVVEYDGVELDYCIDCHGIWFDRDELEWLLLKGGLTVDALQFRKGDPGEMKAAGEADRKCPRCLKKMRKIVAGGDKNVIIDRCEIHGGYWFDGGELHSVVCSGLSEGEWEKVAGFLEELFPESCEQEE